MKKNKFQKNNKQKGFVLLFAVLISTLVLAVGISMISIALKQVVLSGSGRDSQYAFYAANTGAECATYWDLASSSVFTSTVIPGTSVTCLNNDVSTGNPLAAKWALAGGISKWNNSTEADYRCYKESNNITTTQNPLEDPDWCFKGTAGINGDTYAKFRIAYNDKPYCADVVVRKQWDSVGLVATTTVTSRGYNTCDSANTRRIERALEFSY